MSEINRYFSGKGICRYWFETTLDEVSRLRFIKEAAQTLREHDAAEFFVCRSCTHEAVILCPENNWPLYIEYLKAELAGKENTQIDIRKYLPNKPAKLDKYGRIYLATFAIEHAGIEKNGNIVVAGMDHWYECWSYDRWSKVSK